MFKLFKLWRSEEIHLADPPPPPRPPHTLGQLIFQWRENIASRIRTYRYFRRILGCFVKISGLKKNSNLVLDIPYFCYSLNSSPFFRHISSHEKITCQVKKMNSLPEYYQWDTKPSRKETQKNSKLMILSSDMWIWLCLLCHFFGNVIWFTLNIWSEANLDENKMLKIFELCPWA